MALKVCKMQSSAVFSLHIEDIGPATRTTPFGWSPRLIDRGVYDEMVCDAGDLEEGPNEHSWILDNAFPEGLHQDGRPRRRRIVQHGLARADRNTCPDGGWRCRAAEGPPRIVPRRPVKIED